MNLFSWLRSARPESRRPAPRAAARLHCESLEARDVPTTFYPTNAAELVAAVEAANGSAEADTIVLTAGATYTLTAVNNTTYGRTGLPVVESEGGQLSIVGNGATVERSTATGTPAFRLIAVEAGASLTAENLTLQNGRIDSGQAQGYYGAAGGAVLNQGTTTLWNVTVQNNVAAGWSGSQSYSYGSPAAGGGVFSTGMLTITGGAIRNNQALGGDSIRGRDGGAGHGGGVYVGDGTADLTDVTLADNTARGGDGGDGYWVYPSRGSRYRVPPGDGGTGYGGGLYASTAVVTLTDCTVSGNKALGGPGGGEGYGGGIYVGYGATVDWDSDTQFSQNRASTAGKDFYRV